MNDIWVITSLYRFFPGKNQNRDNNFYEFRERLPARVKLAVIEIVRNNAQFSLSGSDADKLVQLRTPSVLWHKERALNLLVKELHPQCKYVAWIDADSVLLNDDWLRRGAQTLRYKNAVQLCSECHFLNQAGEPNFVNRSYMAVRDLGPLPNTGRKSRGFPGFGWMAKRDFFRFGPGLYDKAIMGGGDLLFADAVSRYKIRRWMTTLSEGYHRDYGYYRQRMQNFDATYIKGVGQHLWHDDPKYRLYSQRHFILHELGYHPKKDLTLDKNGLYEITRPELRKAVEEYFWFREAQKTPEHDAMFADYETRIEELKEQWLSRFRSTSPAPSNTSLAGSPEKTISPR